MKMFRKRFYKQAAAVLVSVTAATIFLPKVSAEDAVLELQGMFLFVSADSWNNRNLRVIGRGKSNALVYGGTQTHTLYNLAIDPQKNQVNFYGGYYDGILEKRKVNISGNEINIFDGDLGWIVYDNPDKVNDAYTRVHVFSNNDANFGLNLIAGHGGLGEIYNNKINIYGGVASGIITPAESKVGTDNFSMRMHDNEVNIYGNADLRFAKLYGAALFSDDTREHLPTFGTDNALNIYGVKDISVAELNAFNNYNFYLPENVKNQDKIISVTGDKTTDISGSQVYAVVPENAALKISDRVTLIQNNAGVTDSADTSYVGVNSRNAQPKWYIDTSTEADIIVEKADANNVVLRFQADELAPPTKLIVENRVPTTINKIADFLAGDLATIEAAGSQIFTPFCAITNGSMTYKTGSSVKVRGANMIVGFSRKIDNPTRNILIAPLVEYGRGNYDSYLDGGEHGYGHHRNLGGGIVFRTKLTDGNFYDGSIRAGRLKTDFESTSFGADRNVMETFKTNSHYIGAHFGVGREVKYNPKCIFTYSTKFLYSHTGAGNVQITSGEDYHLSSVNSYRLKFGLQEEYESNDIHHFYIGAGVQYEFGSKAFAEYNGRRTDTASVRGTSGVFELGWIIRPRGDETFSMDLSGVGSVGKSRGLTGRFGIDWRF